MPLDGNRVIGIFIWACIGYFQRNSGFAAVKHSFVHIQKFKSLVISPTLCYSDRESGGVRKRRDPHPPPLWINAVVVEERQCREAKYLHLRQRSAASQRKTAFYFIYLYEGG